MGNVKLEPGTTYCITDVVPSGGVTSSGSTVYCFTTPPAGGGGGGGGGGGTNPPPPQPPPPPVPPPPPPPPPPLPPLPPLPTLNRLPINFLPKEQQVWQLVQTNYNMTADDYDPFSSGWTHKNRSMDSSWDWVADGWVQPTYNWGDYTFVIGATAERKNPRGVNNINTWDIDPVLRALRWNRKTKELHWLPMPFTWYRVFDPCYGYLMTYPSAGVHVFYEGEFLCWQLRYINIPDMNVQQQRGMYYDHMQIWPCGEVVQFHLTEHYFRFKPKFNFNYDAAKAYSNSVLPYIIAQTVVGIVGANNIDYGVFLNSVTAALSTPTLTLSDIEALILDMAKFIPNWHKCQAKQSSRWIGNWDGSGSVQTSTLGFGEFAGWTYVIDSNKPTESWYSLMSLLTVANPDWNYIKQCLCQGLGGAEVIANGNLKNPSEISVAAVYAAVSSDPARPTYAQRMIEFIDDPLKSAFYSSTSPINPTTIKPALLNSIVDGTLDYNSLRTNLIGIGLSQTDADYVLAIIQNTASTGIGAIIVKAYEKTYNGGQELDSNTRLILANTLDSLIIALFGLGLDFIAAMKLLSYSSTANEATWADDIVAAYLAEYNVIYLNNAEATVDQIAAIKSQLQVYKNTLMAMFSNDFTLFKNFTLLAASVGDLGFGASIAQLYNDALTAKTLADRADLVTAADILKVLPDLTKLSDALANGISVHIPVALADSISPSTVSAMLGQYSALLPSPLTQQELLDLATAVGFNAISESTLELVLEYSLSIPTALTPAELIDLAIFLQSSGLTNTYLQPILAYSEFLNLTLQELKDLITALSTLKPPLSLLELLFNYSVNLGTALSATDIAAYAIALKSIGNDYLIEVVFAYSLALGTPLTLEQLVNLASALKSLFDMGFGITEIQEILAYIIANPSKTAAEIALLFKPNSTLQDSSSLIGALVDYILVTTPVISTARPTVPTAFSCSCVRETKASAKATKSASTVQEDTVAMAKATTLTVMELTRDKDQATQTTDASVKVQLGRKIKFDA